MIEILINQYKPEIAGIVFTVDAIFQISPEEGGREITLGIIGNHRQARRKGISRVSHIGLIIPGLRMITREIAGNIAVFLSKCQDSLKISSVIIDRIGIRF